MVIESHTKCLDQQDNLQKMERELQGKPIMTTTSNSVKTTPKWPTGLPPVDIYCIGAVGFYWTLIKPNVIPFITSLYEIDRLIEQKEVEAIQADTTEKEITNQELIEQKYHDFKDVFSKAASDQLPPCYSCS